MGNRKLTEAETAVIAAAAGLPKERRVAVLTALSKTTTGKCFVSCADVQGACPLRTDGKDCDGLGETDYARMLKRLNSPEFNDDLDEWIGELMKDLPGAK